MLRIRQEYAFVIMLRVFAVNRPLVSSKLKRLPQRGMLGNGLRVVMGAVAAHDGTIDVTTNGRTYELGVSPATGATTIISSRASPQKRRLSVTVTFPNPRFSDGLFFGRRAIELAQDGERYEGRSQPHWYSPKALCDLLASAPDNIPLSRVIEDVFGIADSNPEPTEAWAADFIARHSSTPRQESIGFIGEDAYGGGGYYRKVTDRKEIDGALIPFCVEAWVDAERAERDDGTRFYVHPTLNRSPILAHLVGYADSTGLNLSGCGMPWFKIKGPKRAHYDIDLSLITPYAKFTGDGKAPYLDDFRDAIEAAIKGAAGEAYRNLVRPTGEMKINEAAAPVMREAYLKASDNGTLPAKARQIMYAARGEILELTGLKKFSDTYFTQVLLPDYLNDNPEDTADWDVVYDARGHFTEPHTGVSVPLGTVQVREYLGQRPRRFLRPQLQNNKLFPTNGPEHRYRNILFVEKEGFDEMFEAVRLAQRYDLSIMSTKGMSVTAARKLIDQLAPMVDHIFVLHDFDVSGFSIFGTLSTDSRRYIFNDLSETVIDIGLRLEHVEAMGLEPEIVEVKNRDTRCETLERHGANDDEIEFLAPYDDDDDCQRVELNAMTSRQLVDFVEQQLNEHGVKKVVPGKQVLQQHARHLLETKYTAELIAEHAPDIARRATAAKLPSALADKVTALLKAEPALSWDQALSRIIGSD